MYSSHSPVLSALDHSIGASSLNASSNQSSGSGQCLRFKYFTTFVICTISLALLSASLATHKWIVSRPIRVLRLNGAQHPNFTALMLSAAQQQQQPEHRHSHPRQLMLQQADSFQVPPIQVASSSSTNSNGKFQGEIYFGLFNGVKVLNYGFGDRVSQISVVQWFLAKDTPTTSTSNSQQEPLVNFKLWLVTLSSVLVAILFALVGAIFAIINFVMTPKGTLSGPIGLVIWNAVESFACLIAMVCWLIEYFARLQTNVLTDEEVQNGWTSENRSQFGYSYYFVVLAFVLSLVNIFTVSLVQFESWSSDKAANRQSRALCEGVIMLY